MRHLLDGRKAPALGALGLAIVAVLLHGNALRQGWKFDDGPQLLFAATYSPWQYFGVAEVMRLQSYAHIAPWNALFFDLGLPLFGLWAPGHYAHLLVIVWLTAVASWRLLARWLHPEAAFSGALLFLAMPSTGAVTHMLMTGHYAYGLFFSVAMLLAFARAAQSNSWRWACAASLLYALACACKELYVPLVVLLLVWPGPDRRSRLLLAAPTMVVAAAYALMRLHVLGGIGGYAALEGGHTTLALNLPALLAGADRARAALVGTGWSGWLALVVAVSSIGLAWRRGRRPAWPWLCLSLGVVLAPVLPLLLFVVPNGLERLLMLAAWSAAMLVAWQVEGLPHRRPLVAALLALLILGQRATVDGIEHSQRPMSAQNDFLAHAGPSHMLVPDGFAAIGLLEAMRGAAQQVTSRPGAVLIGSEEQFIALGEDKGRAASAWQPECDCIRPLGDAYPQRVRTLREQWSAGHHHALRVQLQLENLGRAKVFRWLVDGAEGQLHLEVRHELRVALPRQGALAFGTDATFRPPDPVALRMIVTTPDQASVRSPWLSLPLSRSSRLDWQGPGTLPPPAH